MGQFLSQQDLIERIGVIVSEMYEEYGLPYSSAFILYDMGDIWIKEIDFSDKNSVNFMKYRIAQYIKKFKCVEDFSDLEFEHLINRRQDNLGIKRQPISVFMCVGSKKFIKELSYTELMSIDTCKKFFTNCSDEDLAKFVNKYKSEDFKDLSGVELLNKLFDLNYSIVKKGAKFLDVDENIIIKYGENNW